MRARFLPTGGRRFSSQTICTWSVTAGRSPISIRTQRLRAFFTACRQQRFLTAPSSLDDGSQASTTEGARWDPLFIEYSHRSHESCEGGLQYHTSQSSFRLRQCPPHDGQGMFPCLLRPEALCSPMARIQWPTNWTMSSSA